MSINQWRYVRYTDDGCALYQCLHCYGEWEGRGAPGYVTETGKYTPLWNYCPLCATKWEKMRTTDSEWFKDQQIGPRRMKIEQAEIEYYRYHDRYASPEPPFWYVLEEKMHWHCRTPEDAEWEPKWRMAGLSVSAKEALEFKRQYMARNREETEEKYEFEDDKLVNKKYTLVYHFRLVVVKATEAERRYPHKWRYLNQHRIYR